MLEYLPHREKEESLPRPKMFKNINEPITCKEGPLNQQIIYVVKLTEKKKKN